MTTITDQIAAWPPIQERYNVHGYAFLAEALEARLRTATEIVQALASDIEQGVDPLDKQARSTSYHDARAFLAAREKEEA
jgi:hypothetical protein